MTESVDIMIIGAGIAGASAAAALAADAKVALLEMESQPGYHATGRSAAFFAGSYGSEVVRGITAASEQFYREPPGDFSTALLLRPRDAIFIARADQQDSQRQMQAEVTSLTPQVGGQLRGRVPILDPDYVLSGLLDDSGGDLDVDAILQGFLRRCKQRGGRVVCNSRIESLRYKGGVWEARSEDGSVSAPIVVNAAGAWAGQVGVMAGLSDLQLQPKRRTALLIESPEEFDVGDWPLVIDMDEQFYFKPDAGHLLVSPADETPLAACDASPDEMDLAIAIDRFEKATTLSVRRIQHKWAGLRTFAPDKNFVVGFDPRQAGFYWLAGQGGYGVQSAPGLAQLVHAQISGATLSEQFAPVLSFAEAVAPERFL